MKGWIYRRAVDIKDFGERMRPRFIGRIVRDIGLAIRDRVLKHSTKKIAISYKTADILDWICTVIFSAMAFWTDWRIGLAFIIYDLSRVCEKVKDEWRNVERMKRFLEDNPDFRRFL